MPIWWLQALTAFLIWLAGLQVDETPKHQMALPTIDNHALYDLETGLLIHLKLNGIFSYFPDP